MSERNETVLDIVAEIREKCGSIDGIANGIADFLKLADRIEAARLRESQPEYAPEPLAEWLEKNKDKIGIENFKGLDVAKFIAEQRGGGAAGNAARLRAALKDVLDHAAFATEHATMLTDGTGLLARVRAALYAPTRNCDVGTAKEQKNRFDEFCNLLCKDCPAMKEAERSGCCELAWGQLPYEEAQEGGDHADA